MALFVESFLLRSRLHPHRQALHWLKDSGEISESLSFEEVESQAASVAGFLASKCHLQQGDRVLLSFPPGTKFLATFLACLSLGIIAVPVYPPSPASFKRDIERLQLIACTAGASVVLTSESYAGVVTALKWKAFLTGGTSVAEHAKWRAVPDSHFKRNRALKMEPVKLDPDALAFLQFTSGSTGEPKGVMVSHGNIAHNLSAMKRHTPQDDLIFVSWMPQYHDFGLICMMLSTLYFGFTAYIMSPLAFLKDPLVWLRAVTMYRGQLTAAPNFAYTRCVKAWRRLPPDRRPHLDLSSLLYCFNAAEPIRPSTLADFTATFCPLGFPRDSFKPAYGLAEHVVYACIMWTRNVVIDEQTGFVACGEADADPDIDILIMSLEGNRACAEGETGEIWLSSPSKTAGYWGRPEATKDTFQNVYGGKEYLRTGDLGFIKDGLLFITGRLKDVIIVGGRNLYPQDIEVTVEGVSPDIRPGCTAAFQLHTGLGQDCGPEDHVGVVAELRVSKLPPEDLTSLFTSIRRAVAASHGVQVVKIALVMQRTIPKTTSGKIRRSTCREFLAEGKLQLIPGGLFESKEPVVLHGAGAPDTIMQEEGAEPAGLGMSDAPASPQVAAALLSQPSSRLLGQSAPPEAQIRAEVMDLISAATALPASSLDPHMPLVELGVGSLQAIQMGADLEDKFGVSLDPALLFSGCTLEELVQQVASLVAGRPAEKCPMAQHRMEVSPAQSGLESEVQVGSSAAALCQTAELDGLQPPSYNQQQMFLLDFMAATPEARVAYNIPAALELRGALDVPALTAALQQLCGRQASLRARFVLSVDGQPLVEYVSTQEFKLPFESLDLDPVHAGRLSGCLLDDPAIKAVTDNEARRAFDLSKGPLVRFLLLKAAPDAHVLMVTMHHSVSDGWSVLLLFNELSELYSSCLGGSSATAPPPPAIQPYASYASWQRSQEHSGAWGPALEFWRAQLASLPRYLGLPYTSNALEPVRAGPGGYVPISVPEEVLTQLNKLAVQHSTTLYCVLLAALGVLLMRYSGEEDVCLVTPHLGRTHAPGLMSTIGMFVNTLPLRLSVEKALRFGELLDRVAATVKAAVANSQVPFQHIVDQVLGPGGSPFQVMLVHQDYRLTMVGKMGGVLASPVFDFATGAAKFDLGFELISTQDGELQGRLNYSSTKFTQEAAAAVAGHFCALLASIAAEPAAAVTLLPIMGQHEQGTILASFSCGPCRPQYMEGPLAVQLFEQQAASSPDRACLLFEGQVMTYQEVSSKANLLAHRLVGMGICGGKPVGVMLERSFELVISILAVLKAGGCYLPLDPSFPDDRLAIYLADSGAAAVILTQNTLQRAQQLSGGAQGWQAVCIEQCWGEHPPDQEEDLAAGRLDAASPAYIIFTSGSTGRPKGVPVPQGALRDYVRSKVDYFGLGEGDIFVLSTTISFDPHIFQVFAPLVSGGRLVIARPEGHLDPPYMVSLMLEHHVTYFNTVPSLALEYYKEPATKQLTSLKGAMHGGEPLPIQLVQLIYSQIPGVQVYNWYGPTEATVHSSTMLIPEGDSEICIGTPEANVHCYIVDSNMRPVPLGVPGELLLSGPRLAAGYVNQKELTAASFVPNPCYAAVEAQIPPAMRQYYVVAYRTGDLVRWRHDGAIVYLGRLDRQVKINGVRIEMGEVEAALAGGPGVDRAVAAAVPDPSSGAKRLLGFVTPVSVDPSAALAHCRKALVPAMVPTAVVPLASLPLLPNGKVDMKQLPIPDLRAPSPGDAYVAPATEDEMALQLIWMEVLGSEEPISVTADFFAIGGSSLRAGKLNSLVRRELGVADLPATHIYKHPNIRDFAAAIRLHQLAGTDAGYKKQPSKLLAQARTMVALRAPRSFLERALEARLSAEDQLLAEHMPRAVRPTRLPYGLYLALQAVLSLLACAYVPLLLAGTLALTLLFYHMSSSYTGGGVWICIPLGMASYAMCLIASAAILVLCKWALLQRLQPGIHPLFGWMYLRWISYNNLQRQMVPWIGFYIRRTRLLTLLFRLLGAHIEENVVLDTYDLYEPDLVAIGANSTVGKDAVITAAFVAPPCFADEVGCLIISTTRIGSDCTVGRLASLPAGSRLPDGHSLKPFRSPAQPQAVVKGPMPELPQFQPERHLSPLCTLAASLAFFLASLLLLMPGFISATAVLFKLYGIDGPGFLPMLRDAFAHASSAAEAKVLLLPLIIILLSALFRPVSMISQTAGVVLFKWLVMGKLCPGLHLTGSQWLLFRYSIFKRLLSGSYFQEAKLCLFAANKLNALFNILGANIGKDTLVTNGLIEFDAITFGERCIEGGITHIQCIDSEGFIRPVVVESGVNFGHAGFYAGCKVQAGAMIGNETSVAAGCVVPAGTSLVGAVTYPTASAHAPSSCVEAGKAASSEAPAAVLGDSVVRQCWGLLLMLLQTSLSTAATWGPGGVAFAACAMAVGLNAWLVLLVICGGLFIMALGVVWSVLLTRAVYWLSRSRQLFARGWASPLDLRYLTIGHAFLSLNSQLLPWLGTPWLTHFCHLAGWHIGRGSIIMGMLPVEMSLFTAGDIFVDLYAKVTSHFVDRGLYVFNRVRAGDGAWVQLLTRCLAVPVLGSRSRILPASIVMPNDEVQDESVWGGVPANPLGQLRKPDVRSTANKGMLQQRMFATMRDLTMRRAGPSRTRL